MAKKKILVVDDEPPVRRVLTLCLTTQGYEVRTVTNGLEAMETLKSYEPDALLTDITMPKMTGRELCQKIHEEYPERKYRIFVMTSNVGSDERQWVAELSDIVFLEKPLSPRMLTGMLADYFMESTI